MAELLEPQDPARFRDAIRTLTQTTGAPLVGFARHVEDCGEDLRERRQGRQANSCGVRGGNDATMDSQHVADGTADTVDEFDDLGLIDRRDRMVLDDGGIGNESNETSTPP